jgi:hypothetical protein
VFLHQPVQILAREMFFGAKEYFHDQVSLRRPPQTCLLDVLKEDLPLFTKLLFTFRHLFDI